MKPYAYQQKVIDEASTKDLGYVKMPTGSGKTLCELEIILNSITSKKDSNIYVITCPRILLCVQHYIECFAHYTSKGIKGIDLKLINSGTISAMDKAQMYLYLEEGQDIGIDIQSNPTTDKSAIANYILNAEKNNNNIIFFCVINSYPNLVEVTEEMGKRIELAIHDEAHTVTSASNWNAMQSGKSVTNRSLFFTATPNLGDSNGRSMSNSEMFGEELDSSISENEAVAMRLIVPPSLVGAHCPLNLTDDIKDTDKYIRSIVCTAFGDLKKRTAYNNDRPVKLLVTVSSQHVLNALHSAYLSEPLDTVSIYSTCSDYGSRINDKTESTLSSWLTKLKKDKSDSIICHVKQLTTGIDVPDISGVLILKIMGDDASTELLQTYGRCARLHPEDRANRDNPSYSFIKKNGLVYYLNTISDPAYKSRISRLLGIYTNGATVEDSIYVDIDRNSSKEAVEFEAYELRNQKDRDLEYISLEAETVECPIKTKNRENNFKKGFKGIFNYISKK